MSSTIIVIVELIGYVYHVVKYRSVVARIVVLLRIHVPVVLEMGRHHRTHVT